MKNSHRKDAVDIVGAASAGQLTLAQLAQTDAPRLLGDYYGEFFNHALNCPVCKRLERIRLITKQAEWKCCSTGTRLLEEAEADAASP